ncbi:hypothetical protein AAG906_000521 [Vitis piasezkii]
MTQEETQSMQNILRNNHDIFAWTHSDMKGIHPSIASHKLNVFSTARPVRQKIRRFHPDRQKIIRNEMDKLLEAGFIEKYLIRHRKVYIDDIVVKSRNREEHVLHLQEVFHLLKRYDMKLNPSKCAFGVSAGKFLGFMVSQRGIEVSPDQVKAVMETPPPRSKKEAGPQGWTDSCQSAFEKIKHCLTQPPILSSPVPKEKLYMYLAVSEWAIGRLFTPFTKGAKPSTMLAGHWRIILHKPDLRRMLQWAIELSEFGIEFQPRLSKKGQVMADFVLEYSRRPNQHHESKEQEWWTLRVDGASRSSGSGVGLVLQSPTGECLEQAIRLGFPASNNEAEYEAILSGLDLALALSVSKLRIYSDSQLVVRHVQKEYEAKDARMARYLAKVRSTLQQFTEWTIEKIKRADNGHYLRTVLYPETLNSA